MSRHLTNRDRLSFKLDHLSDTEIQEVLEYVSIMENMKRETVQPESSDDDILALLSAAIENRRAQQVYEWDNIRKRSDSRAAFPVSTRRTSRATAGR
ncbi:MAG TPA: hypothetical protein VEF04_20170 [Blastocatellia bacterium]|nr:hypothetical protein [Blastocatellia bacterium]